MSTAPYSPLFICGNAVSSGAYLLHIQIQRPLTIPLGRFQKAKPISFAAGDYLYVGSAMGAHGPTSFPGRLLRHATRSFDLPPHPIRTLCLQRFGAAGLGTPPLNPPTHKRAFWHIDYLLDQLDVDLVQIFVIRTVTQMEALIARRLACEPYTFVVEPGIGASDDHGATHLFGLYPDQPWAEKLVESLSSLLPHL